MSSTSDLPQLQQHQQAPPPPGTAAASSDLDSFSLSGGDTVMAAADPVKVEWSQVLDTGVDAEYCFVVLLATAKYFADNFAV